MTPNPQPLPFQQGGTVLARLTIVLALFVAACATAPPGTSAPASRPTPVVELSERYYDTKLEFDPFQATEIGDNRFNDRFTMDIDPADRAARSETARRFRDELLKIDRAALTPEDALTWDIFRTNLTYELDLLDHPAHLLPINQFSSVPAYFVELGSGAGIHPFRTVKDYDDFLARIDGFVRWTDLAIANMQEGVRTGIVQPRILIDKAIPQFEAQVVASPDESIFYRPVTNMPASFSEADRIRLTAAYRAAIQNQVVPAYRRLAAFLRTEYLPATRDTVGLSQLPGGRDWYAALVRRSTTTGLTPEEIHEIGLREVIRIQGEMNSVMRTVGFTGTVREFGQHLLQDPRFRFKSREEIVQTYRDIKQRVDRLTPKLFDTIPRADYEVKPVEPFQEATAAGGSYQPATPDGTRPGVFWVNTYRAPERANYSAEALSLHEGAPGHHFQLSIQREQENLPRLRRFDLSTAYVEGWGLYAESLGKELGVYADPYQYYGSLSSELWRSIRLVLDTGLHAKGWSRQQAIDYAYQNSGNTTFGIEAEVDRFIAIPGQALAYKIGQLEISALRSRAERELGSNFDLREFHRQVLIDGAMPLEVLRAKVERWIATKKG
jgi:uncharacterized protein (DUF885 family)